MTSTSWTQFYELDTSYNSDSVEWCPIEPYLCFFVCGTYLLLENNENTTIPQERIGSLLLLKITSNGIINVQTVDTRGILDCKWLPHTLDGKILLALVNAVGNIAVHSFEDEKLHEKAAVSLKTVEEGAYMTLSVNWCNDNTSTMKASLCVTDNKGNAALLEYSSEGLVILEKWNAHSLEAWTIAPTSDPNLIYTGGDDAKLRVWDLRCGTSSPTTTLSKQNTGVTIIATETGLDYTFLSGSFDEILLFWDSRMLKIPKNEVQSSGGLWRIKCRNKFALTANIYGGFQIVDMKGDPRVVANFKNHSSLAYGADWSLLSASNLFNVPDSSMLVGLCSFYDNKLTVSVWDSEAETEL